MVILGKEAEFQGLGGMGGAAESIFSFFENSLKFFGGGGGGGIS